MLIAITRPVSSSIAKCQLTHLARKPIDLARARQQHGAYEKTLESLGVFIRRMPAADRLPDAVFIEDTAVAVEGVAIIARPGAPARQREVEAVATVLKEYRPVVHLRKPATLDGGDVLRIGRTLYVGRSSRTNDDGIRQLRGLLVPFGYKVEPVEVNGCLHLKSAATLIGENIILVNPAWISADAFAGMERIEVDPDEPYAANALLVEDTLVFPAHFPRTRERLLARGLKVATVECGELAKAEGAVTCCSILVKSQWKSREQ